MTNDHIRGCIFGAAYGDALGKPTEFIKPVTQIIKRYPDLLSIMTAHPTTQVTDDTQMMLAVGEALAKAGTSRNQLEPTLIKAFVTWANSPDNNRAPGNTCMSSCRNLENGIHWVKATAFHSKGCGANMRVQPVGILNIDTDTRAALAQFQAALTHGHPTGLAAADITAHTIALILAGTQPDDLIPTLKDYINSQLHVYHVAWLDNLWEQSSIGYTSAEDFIQRGWEEVEAELLKVEAALQNPDYDTDPSIQIGEAWVAEEAFSTGLFCFLLYPDDPVAAIKRAAISSGDSDSIATIAGAFAGAYKGFSAWPTEWHNHIEYRDRLEAITTLGTN